MNDPRNPTLATRAALWADIPAQRATTPDFRKQVGMPLAAGNIGIDRAALTRFLAILVALFLAYLAAGPSTDEDGWGVVNALCPIVLCLAALWTAFKVVRADSRAVWTPIPWFSLVVAVFFGFGPLLYLFADQDQIERANSFCRVGPYVLWYTNLLNTVSIMVITAAFLVADKLMGTGQLIDRTASPSSASRDDSARTATCAFLGIGVPVQFLLVLPRQLKLLDFMLPGFVQEFQNFAYLAVFMLAYLSAKRKGLWRFGFWAFFVLEVLANATTLMKRDMLLVFIMAALGRFMATKRVKELVYFGMGTIALYVLLLSPLIAWSRFKVAHENSGYDNPFSQRLSVMAEGLQILLTQGELKNDTMSKQEWWGRINFANMQAAAISFYDAGVVGDSFMWAVYGWIPRLIWPDKPGMVLGLEFTILLKGADAAGETSTGPGIFAEAYWNGGWLMVVLACGYIGILFAWFSRLAFRTLAGSEWLFLPCLFMGIVFGLKIDGWFASTYVTGALMCVEYYFIIRFCVGFGKNQE